MKILHKLLHFEPQNSDGSYNHACLIAVSALTASGLSSEQLDKYVSFMSRSLTLLKVHGASEKSLVLSLLCQPYETTELSVRFLEEVFGDSLIDDIRSLVPVKKISVPNKRLRRELKLAELDTSSVDVQNVRCVQLIVQGSQILMQGREFSSVYMKELNSCAHSLSKALPALREKLEAVGSADMTVVNILNFSASFRRPIF